MELGGSTPRPGRFNPGKEARHPVPGPVWTDAENFIPTDIRSPVRPARSAYYAIQANVTLHAEYNVYESRRSRPQVNRLERRALYSVGPVRKLAKSQLLGN